MDGIVVGGKGLYDGLIEFAGVGATVPITSFDNALVIGALQDLKTNGWIHIITGIFEVQTLVSLLP